MTVRVEWDVSPPCDGCGDPLSAMAMEHGEEGFGHQGLCCACYEQHNRGELRRKRKRSRRGAS
jgi:hypothetical protein